MDQQIKKLKRIEKSGDNKGFNLLDRERDALCNCHMDLSFDIIHLDENDFVVLIFSLIEVNDVDYPIYFKFTRGKGLEKKYGDWVAFYKKDDDSHETIELKDVYIIHTNCITTSSQYFCKADFEKKRFSFNATLLSGSSIQICCYGKDELFELHFEGKRLLRTQFLDNNQILAFKQPYLEKSRIRELENEVKELKQKIEELQLQIDFMPGTGIEYIKAKNEFESMRDK